MLVRAIVWIFGAFLLTLIPLGVVAVLPWKFETGLVGYLNVLSNEELLAVAFTLGGAASIDVLVNSSGRGRPFKVLAGCCALIFTLITAIGYVLLKTHLIAFPNEDMMISTVQRLYFGTVLLSFICEILAEA